MNDQAGHPRRGAGRREAARRFGDGVAAPQPPPARPKSPTRTPAEQLADQVTSLLAHARSAPPESVDSNADAWPVTGQGQTSRVFFRNPGRIEAERRFGIQISDE